MKILNIWLNPPIPQKYARCIETQREYFSDCEYEMIDRIKAVEMFAQANDFYNGINMIDSYINSPVEGSDYLRMFALSIQPDTLYLDCDIEITSQPPKFQDVPACEYKAHTDFFNNGMIYNGNHCLIFSRFCEYWFTQKQLHLLFGAVNKFSHDNNLLKIAGNWFTHYMFSAKG